MPAAPVASLEHPDRVQASTCSHGEHHGSARGGADLLTRVAAAVNSSLNLSDVLRRLTEVTVEAVSARAAVFTFEGNALVPRAGFAPSTTADPDQLAMFRSMRPIHLNGDRASEYAEREPVVVPDARSSDLVPAEWADLFDVQTVVLAPLFAAETPCGLLTVDWPEPIEVDDDVLEVIRMIAEHAGLAIRNARMYEAEALHVRRLECLYKLSTAYSEGTDAARLVRQLNQLLADEGVEVTGVSFRDRRITRHLGTAQPTKTERALWKNNLAMIKLPEGGLAVPMYLGRRCIGALRIADDDLEPDHRSFLEALGAALAEVANRAAMRATLEQEAQERAVANERERLQADLHDTAGQTFAAIGLVASRESARRPHDPQTAERFDRLHELAEQGRSELDQAVHALAFAPKGRRRLVASLRAFCKSVQNDSGMCVSFSTNGSPRRLPNRVEYALYRVGAEAVMNSWRHARASYVRVTITKETDAISLEVVDDGIGLEARHDGSAHVGIDGMRRAASDVEGQLTVRHAKPRGVQVAMVVPATGKGSGQ